MTCADIHIRPLAGYEELQECVALEKRTWGEDFDDVATAAILLICRKVGGLVAGAFDTAGRLVGVVFGLTGVRGGRLVHWSHMLAVEPHLRDHGLGRRLKFYQRDFVLEMGIDLIYWTYDPLEARNAHFNINRLGVNIDEYVRDLYGPGDTSPVFQGIGTDRFIVAWHLQSDRLAKAERGEKTWFHAGIHEAPIVNTALLDDGTIIPVAEALPNKGIIRVEIPSDIQSVKVTAPQQAADWRSVTRRALEFYLDKEYEVDGFYRDRQSGRCFYVLASI